MDLKQALEVTGTQLTGLQLEAVLTIITAYETELIQKFIDEKGETWLRWHQGGISVARQLRQRISGAAKAARIIRERSEKNDG